MSEELLPPVATDEMRISVEIGDDYEPSERVGAALRELQEALAEESGDDVQGFYTLEDVIVTSHSFHSSAGLFPSRSFTFDHKDWSTSFDKSTPDLL